MPWPLQLLAALAVLAVLSAALSAMGKLSDLIYRRLWYHVKVCDRDVDAGSLLFCDKCPYPISLGEDHWAPKDGNGERYHLKCWPPTTH